MCKTFIYLYVCMQADAHNYTHKSMYTWVVIADANWCSGCHCPRMESGATKLLQKFTKCEECIDLSAPLSQSTWLQNNFKHPVQRGKYVVTGFLLPKVLVNICRPQVK